MILLFDKFESGKDLVENTLRNNRGLFTILGTITFTLPLFTNSVAAISYNDLRCRKIIFLSSPKNLKYIGSIDDNLWERLLPANRTRQ